MELVRKEPSTKPILWGACLLPLEKVALCDQEFLLSRLRDLALLKLFASMFRTLGSVPVVQKQFFK